MASYPTSIASFSNPSSGSPTNSPSHAALHTQENGEIVAIQTALGTGINNTYATVTAALTTLGTLVTAAQTTASAARLLPSIVGTWIAGSVSAGSAYIVSPFAGTVSGYVVQGGAAPAVPGLVTVTVGSAGAVLLTGTPASAGIAGAVTTLSNTSGTTTIAAGGSMLITLAGSGTAYQQVVSVYVARTA